MSLLLKKNGVNNTFYLDNFFDIDDKESVHVGLFIKYIETLKQKRVVLRNIFIHCCPPT